MNLKKSFIVIGAAAMIASVGFETLKLASAQDGPLTYPDSYPETYPVTYPSPTASPTLTPAQSPTPTEIPALTPTGTVTPTVSPSLTPTNSPTPTQAPITSPVTGSFTLSGKIKLSVWRRWIKTVSKKSVNTAGIKINIYSLTTHKTLDITTDNNGNFSTTLEKGKYLVYPVNKNTFFAPFVRLVVLNKNRSINFNAFVY